MHVCTDNFVQDKSLGIIVSWINLILFLKCSELGKLLREMSQIIAETVTW